ncbi:hypothetical protein ACFL0F_02195 [Patescibacteria group bacterium]
MSQETKNPIDLETKPIVLSNERVEMTIDSLGAFVNSLNIDGENVIYPRTAQNPQRGGIPILGPTPGPVNELYWKNFNMKIPSHGTDRITTWGICRNYDNTVTLSRFISPKEFNYPVKKEISYTLLEDGLEMSTIISNFSKPDLEIGHAIHPYFAVNKDCLSTNQEIINVFLRSYPGEATIIRSKPSQSFAQIELFAEDNKYLLENNPPPLCVVIWTDKPEDYTCIETWHADMGRGIVIKGQSSTLITSSIRKLK